MNRNMTHILTLTTLLFGAAQATAVTSVSSTAATSVGSAAGDTAEGNAQFSVSAVVLLDAQGQIVGTANSTGQFVFQGASNAATRAQVTFRNGVKRTYTLSNRLKAQARISLDAVVVAGGSGSLSLSQAIRAEMQAQASAAAQVMTDRALVGKSVALLSASGQVIGTFNARGQWQGSASASQATDVLVTFQNGQRATYSLTQRLAVDARSAVNLDSLQVRTNDRSASLVRVLLDTSATGTVSAGGAGSASTPAAGNASAEASGSAGGTASGSGQGGLGVSVGIGVGVDVGVGTGGK
ncbi:hypothetical protein GCM10010840_21630 [Deinococcus aerolatus]|uniref:Large catalase C-terminal domain-containing protein n=1 Tax=Deinococcus aerolatus TaxID=522487 RepID=A0ABQ2GAC9_9DEIO|nr:hypothetical protein [Deinococcus aerolatus]GGL83528.1 hypothetical protein GCM10010840_21630 [Deinococcus aerolatus]